MVHITIDYKYSSVMLLVMSLAHPEFEGSVNPISTGGRLCPPHFTACPSGFETLSLSQYLWSSILATTEAVLTNFCAQIPVLSHNLSKSLNIYLRISYSVFNMLSSENNKKGFIER